MERKVADEDDGRNSEQVTAILSQCEGRDGDRAAADRLMPLVYDELRRLAAHYLAGERGEHTLQPTAVVHEAYLRLVDQTRVDWQGRTHFFAIGARMLRRVLVDHARARGRAKRGGDWHQVSLQLADHLDEGGQPLTAATVLDLETALERLAGLDPRQAEIVELKFFAGLTNDEIAHHLGVSRRTVAGHWSHARAWLRRELARNPA